MNDENKNSTLFNLKTNQENRGELDLLFEIGRLLASLETMNEAAPQILQAICSHLEFELGELWCLGKDDTVLHLESVWHLPDTPRLEKFVAESRQIKIPVGTGLPGKVWAQLTPVWIENLSGEDQMPRRFFAAEAGLQSGFAFPILLGERFIGAFSFFSTDSRQADDALLQMFAAVGNHIGQFAKREKIESNLRESEDRYRAFIEQSTEGIWRFELDDKFPISLPIEEQIKLSFERGYLAECNDAMARMYGLEKAEELVGSRIADLLDMSDAANVEYIRSFVESGYNLIDAESHEKDQSGNDKYFLNSLIGTIENNYLVRVWGTQRDITEQKRAEQSLADNEERYRALVEATSTVVWRANENGELSFVGSSWEKVSGQSIEEILGAGWLNALHPDDRANTIRVWQQALRTKNIYETEFRVLTVTGEYRWFAVRGVPILNPDGSLREWVGANTDIHERRAAEEKVRESEARFRQMADHAPVMIWVTDADGSCNYLGQSWYKFTGQTPETALGFGWLDATHPDDAARAEEIFLAANAKHKSFKLEYRLRRADGTYAWAIDSAQPRFSGDGEFLGYVGSVIDITDRKIAEERVRESEANFRQLAEAVPQFVWVTETNGALSYVNRQWLEFSGLTLAESNDPQKTAAVFHPDDRERLASEWERALTNGQDLEIEIRMRETGGDYCWFLTRSRPVRDGNGKITKWFGTSTDITARKKAESRLALLAEISELTRTLENSNELLFAVSQAVGEHLQVKRCLFNEIDLERDLEIVHRDYCRGAETVAGRHRISDYSSVTCAAMIIGETVVNNDSRIDPRTAEDYAKTYEPNGERAYVAVPLLRKNQWVASLWVSDDAARRWSRQEISLLETVAERTWTAIEKLRINNDLRESEERLQLAIDISRISTFDIDLKTDAVETDEIGRAIYGFEADEPLTFTKVQSRFHPEDRDEVARRVSAAFAPEGSDDFEVEQRIIRTDGDVRWIRVRGRAFFEGAGAERQAVYCLGTYIDITSNKLGEQALLERERLALLNSDVSRALIKDSSLQDILHVCTEAVVKHLDAAFARIWTLNKETNVLELQASSGMYTHLDGEHSRVPVGKFKIGIIAAERQPHLTNSAIGDARIGDQEWAAREQMNAFAGYPLLVEERLVGVVAMFARQSLTEKTIEALAVAANAIALGIERKHTESERERLLAGEQQARESAEHANYAKDEFIALVSHELRSPLNAMLGWTRILQEQNPDEKTRKNALDVIVRNARSQSRLIEDLLDIARVGKGKLRLELQSTKLIPIINAAIEIIKPTAEANRIEIIETLDRAADFITGDVDRLRQVIDNLLSNAVKFSAPMGKVEIRLEREDGHAKITVSDTGQGISPEFLPQIFERFKQAESSTTRRHGGLGIGLSLARDLVELHGGTISATSAGEGKGSIFTVMLPLRMVAPIKKNSDRVEFMDAQGKLSGFWILAVDDEADARELVSFMLQINGAKVTMANSAVEALEILKNAVGRLPDVVLSDISMPNESGYALLEKIRALPEEHGGQIPAVALTAFNRPEDREAAFEAGFQKHLGKPVEPDDLISAIIETAGAK